MANRFAVLYVALAGIYACKTAVPAALPRILRENPSLNLTFVSTLSTGFAVAYSMAKLCGGFVADLSSPRALLLGSLALSLTSVFLFDRLTQQIALHTALWTLVGFAQGIAWLPAAKLLTLWWPPELRATLWGVLSSAQTVGGMVIPFLFSQTLIAEANVPFGSFVQLSSVVLLLPLSLAFLLLRPPAHLSTESQPPERSRADKESKKGGSKDKPTSVGSKMKVQTAAWWHDLTRLVSAPPFWLLGLATLFAIFARESSSDFIVIRGIQLDGFSEQEASGYRLAWQFGGLLAALGSGYFTERFLGGRTGLVCGFAMLGSCLVHVDSLSQRVVTSSYAAHCLHNALKGLFFFIPSTLCSLMVTNCIRSDASCTATAIGLIGAFAGLGSFVSGIVTPLVLTYSDWQVHHTVIASVSLLSSLLFLIYDVGATRSSRKPVDLQTTSSR